MRRTATKALDQMVRAARKVGVHRLSDFSRTAVFLGRRAEKHAQTIGPRAPTRPPSDSTRPIPTRSWPRSRFRSARAGSSRRFAPLPAAAVALFTTHESRVAIFSSVGLLPPCRDRRMLLATILALGLRHFPRAVHDIRETAHRHFGRSAALPLALPHPGSAALPRLGARLADPLLGRPALSLRGKRERVVLAAGSSCSPRFLRCSRWLTIENIEQRSPLLVAAVDLAERREDASAEDGLRQASAVFPEDSDVWFLLGVYAERAGDYERAQIDYGRAIRADPNDYRPILESRQRALHGGGLRGGDSRLRRSIQARPGGRGDLLQPVSGPRRGLRLRRAVARHGEGAGNLAVPGQRLGRRADPFPGRAGRLLARPRLQPRSRRGTPSRRAGACPGTARPRLARAISPWSLPPARRLALGVAAAAPPAPRSCQRVPALRPRVLRPLPPLRRSGPLLLGVRPVALRKESVDIGKQAPEARALQRRMTWRHRARRIVSLLAPGSHAFGAERPEAGAVTALVFFFGLAAAIVDMRLFDPLTLPVRGPRSGSRWSPARCWPVRLVARAAGGEEAFQWVLKARSRSSR